MKKHKTHVYQQDLNLPCEICGQRFRTRQGLRGHLRMIHGIRNPGVNSGIDPEVQSNQVAKSSQATIEGLKTEVEQLQLEAKKRRLQADFPAAAAGPGDIMAQAGLGSLEGPAKELAQMRAMGVAGQGPAESWWTKLLSNPEGIRIAADALKGILGVRDGGGDNMASLLREMGYSLKDLITGANAPKAGEGLTVAGVSLAGTSLTPQLLQGILQFKAAEAKAAAELQGRQAMSDTLAEAVKLLGPSLAKLAAGSRGRAGGPAGISQEIPEPQDVVICDLCQTENRIPAGALPGMEIKCQGPAGGPECSRTWILEDPRAQRKPKKEKRPAKIAPVVPVTVACPSCGQVIDVSGKMVGDLVLCGVCAEEFNLVSTSEPIPALDVLTEEQKREKAYWDKLHGH